MKGLVGLVLIAIGGLICILCIEPIMLTSFGAIILMAIGTAYVASEIEYPSMF